RDGRSAEAGLAEDDQRGAPKQNRDRRRQREVLPERRRLVHRRLAELQPNQSRFGLPAFDRPVVVAFAHERPSGDWRMGFKIGATSQARVFPRKSTSAIFRGRFPDALVRKAYTELCSRLASPALLVREVPVVDVARIAGILFL